MSEVRVCEGISGLWHYHLTVHPHSSFALCGARTMTSEMPLSQWGSKFGEHFPKRPTYCEECKTKGST